MIDPAHLNLRHLRAFVAICRAGSITRAAEVVHLSQPAITQGLARLEAAVGASLFVRHGRGLTPSDEGRILAFRSERGLDTLETGLTEAYRRARTPRPSKVAARLTAAHLRALVAIDDARSFSAAARALGLAQPSVHRAARDLELATGLALFETTSSGTALTRAALRLSRATRLMLAELRQGLSEIAQRHGRALPGIRIGALPLARSTVLPEVVDRVTAGAGPLRVQIIDGPYPDLLRALRQGDLDLMVGALRDPCPPDMVQEPMFADRLGVFCGPGHPLLGLPDPTGRLTDFPWVLSPLGTPTRTWIEAALPDLLRAALPELVETSSMVMVRGLLQSGRRLTIISRNQVATEVRTGLMRELPVTLADRPRPIGITSRADWVPTPAQTAVLAALRTVAADWKESQI
ncbi:LysR family transcriptional regulator [Silicimonas algicola]|uniref:DNA-binding transcriptional LysR family regulator n=1 Tax=Silicimonas algicola TaxID=1826607 RepID=A0A316G4H0_9RHOB|nr:LysR family transcriptional regulator [Silicimonas algicola]PWK55215.1 DNA-binding transcriptional LysR family regulator [Silicimonas algicola]